MRKLSFWWFAMLVTTGAVLLALTAPWPAKASTASPQDDCPGSCVTLSPTAGPAGTEVTATGSDWPAGDQIQAIWGSLDGPYVGSQVTVADDGTFTESFAVPSNAALGSAQVFFWDIPGQYFEIAGNAFDVTPPVTVKGATTWGYFAQTGDKSHKAGAHATTSFTPGELIEYLAWVSNSGGTAISETFSYAVNGPNGSTVYSWSGSYPVAPGTNGYILPSVIPNDPPQGTYTITATVSLNGTSSSSRATFKINGEERYLGKGFNGTKNPYTNGECTYGADSIFASYVGVLNPPGGPYLKNFGDAHSWAGKAKSYGWKVSSTPQVNSIVVFQPGVDGTDKSAGHVAWVTAVSGSTITVLEMNRDGRVTPNKYWYSPYTPDQKSGIQYILATGTPDMTWAQVRVLAHTRSASVFRVARP